jgi:hypothetical protein
MSNEAGTFWVSPELRRKSRRWRRETTPDIGSYDDDKAERYANQIRAELRKVLKSDIARYETYSDDPNIADHREKVEGYRKVLMQLEDG